MATIKVKRKENTDTPGSLVHGELGVTQNKLFYGNQAGNPVAVATEDHLHSEYLKKGTDVLNINDVQTHTLDSNPINETVKVVSVNGDSKISTNLFDNNKTPTLVGVSVSQIANGIKVKSNSGGTWQRAEYNYNLKPNTQYTLKATANVIAGTLYVIVLDSLNNNLANTSNNNILITFTTPSNGIIVIRLYVTTSTSSSGEIDFTNIQLNEGTTALPYEPYWEGIKNSNPTKIISKSSNLFDIDSAKDFNNYYAYGSNPAYGYVSYKIDLKPNTYYKIKRKNNLGYGTSGLYALINESLNTSITGKWLVHSTSQSLNQSEYTILTDNVGSILFTVGFSSQTKINELFEIIDTIQLNEGTTALPYQPYAEHIYPLGTGVELPKLPNGVGDRWLSDGSVERNVGKINLWDTSKSIFTTDSSGHTTNFYSIYISNIGNYKLKGDFLISLHNITRYSTLNSYRNADELAIFTSSTYPYIYLKLPRTHVNSYADARSYCLTNNVVLYYELEIPTIENAPIYPKYIATFDKGHIEIDEGLMGLEIPVNITDQVNTNTNHIQSISSGLNQFVKKDDNISISKIVTDSVYEDYILIASSEGGVGAIPQSTFATATHYHDASDVKISSDGEYIFNNDTVEVALSSLDTQLSTQQTDLYNKADKTYVHSRGQNLLTNGSALLGNNTNFSKFTYDGSEAYYSGGSFRYKRPDNGGQVASTDEFMPVNPELRYKFEMFAKSLLGTGYYYYYIDFYDVDGNQISAEHHMYRENTLTTLAQDLKPGDTVMYLNSATNWDNSSAGTHLRSLIIWDYKNSFGYQYPPETYSRYWTNNAWNIGGINYTNNTITLRVPWSGRTVPAGTYVSNGSSGGTYKYLWMGYFTTDWEYYSGIVEGVDLSGKNAGNKFPPGTAKAKVGWLMDYNVVGDTAWFANLSFGIDYLKPHASAINTYGLGTTSLFGHVKTVDNLLSSTYSDGYALSARQGYLLDTNKQPKHASLTSISGLTTSADQMLYTTGPNTYSTTSLTSFGRSLLDDVDAAAGRTTLGLGVLSILNSVNTDTFDASGGKQLTVAKGGTGQSTYAKGDLLYASATNTLSKLQVGTNGKILKVVSGLPSWETEYSYTHPTQDAISITAASGKVLSNITVNTLGHVTSVGSKQLTTADLPVGPGSNQVAAGDHTHSNYVKSITVGSTTHTPTNGAITLPDELPNPNSLSISLNSGTPITYDGSEAKTVNITPASIGASASGHTHVGYASIDYVDNALASKSDSGHTHSEYVSITDHNSDIDDINTALLSKLNADGTAVNASKLDNQSPSYYRNASNLNAGTVPIARLPVGTTSSHVAAGNHTHSNYVTTTTYNNDIDYINTALNNKLGSLDTAADAFKLGGQSPSYYAAKNDLKLELLRDREHSTSLTSVSSGTTAGSVTLTKSIDVGDTLMIEVNKYSNGSYNPKIVTVTVGTSSSIASTTDSDYLNSWSSFNGTNLEVYTFACWRGGATTLSFGAKRYSRAALSGTTISWTTGTYTLYVGRVWRLNR